MEPFLVQDVERLELHGQREGGFGHGDAAVLADFFGHQVLFIEGTVIGAEVRRA
ncbi:hypothetical protein [Streptomyces sp. NPDC093260]|uniref:hypothetical protein n=1 Tax=Streptomyces sp. NPDC093260 TaxID=3155073 RepID=UPI0034252991